jgi:hypothetical protein
MSAVTSLQCNDCACITNVQFMADRKDWKIEIGCLCRVDIYAGLSVIRSGALLEFLRLLLTDTQAAALAKYEEALNG